MKCLKRALCLMLTSLLVMLVCSCGASDYANNIGIETIDARVKDELALNGGYYNADSDFMAFTFHDPEYVDDYAVTFAQASTDISEYGIFHVSDADKVDDMVELAEEYLESYKANWMTNYLAEEYPKIENAQVKAFGSYVVYSILDEDATNRLHEAVEQALTK